MNKKIIDLILEYKDGNNNILLEIIEMFLPIINEYLTKIPIKDKEDIKEELIYVLIDKINTSSLYFDYISESLFTKKNLLILQNNKFSYKSINSLFNNKYLYIFINKYGLSNFEKTFINKCQRKDFICKYKYESAIKRLYKLLRKSFNSLIADYYRDKNKHNLYLNNMNELGIEYINLIHSVESNKININWNLFDKKDREFLVECFNDERMLTQKEIAQKFNVSQQAIAKRIKKIREKYKNIIKL